MTDPQLLPILEKIDTLLAEKIEPDAPGYVATLLYKGETIFTKSYGYANLDHKVPITEETSFYIASISKQFTAMCILLLEEQGLLDLDGSIRDYLPELHEYANDITIRHLVQHTSGLRDYYELLVLRGQANPLVFDSLTMKDIIDLVHRQSRLASPIGEKFEYCNSGYFLLVELIERITGKSFYQFVDENIFRPLGMETAHFIEDPNKVIPNYATAYDKVKDEYKIYTTRSPLVGPTGIVCRIADLIKWDKCFTNYSLGTGKNDLMAKLVEPGKLKDGSELTYAFGLNVEKYRDLPTVYHGGGLFGYTSFFIRFPTEDFTIIILSNLRQLQTNEISYEVANVFLTEYLKHPPTPKQETEGEVEKQSEKPIEVDVQPLLGLYRSRSSKTTLIVKAEGKGFTMTIRGFDEKYSRHHLFHPVSESEFVLIERREGPVLPPNRLTITKGENGLEMNIYYTDEVFATYDQYRTRWDDFPVQDELSGSYYCEDLDTFYTAVHGESKLILKPLGGEALNFMQNTEAEFRAESNILEVQRTDSNLVTGFAVYLGPTQEFGLDFKKLS